LTKSQKCVVLTNTQFNIFSLRSRESLKNMIKTNYGKMNQALIDFLILHNGLSARISLFS